MNERANAGSKKKQEHWLSLTTARLFHRLTNTHVDSSLMCGIIFGTQFHLSEMVLFRFVFCCRVLSPSMINVISCVQFFLNLSFFSGE